MSGSRAPAPGVKTMDGAKNLDSQHLWTRRRIGSGTYAQFSMERERSVSAPASRAPGLPAWGAPGSGETYNRQTREVVECRAEVGGGHSSDDRQDNITCRSEGPLARCVRSSNGQGRFRPMSLVGRLGRCQHPWQDGMWPVDCLGASRVRENLTHGSGRGCWKRGDPAGHLRVLGRRLRNAAILAWSGPSLSTSRYRASALLHTCRPGHRAAKSWQSGCRRRLHERKATSLAALSQAVSGPRAVREPGHVRKLHAREPGGPMFARCCDQVAGRSGKAKAVILR